MGDLKSLSKTDFNCNNNTLEAIQASALIRIADASELMARNFLELQRSNDYLKRRNQELLKDVDYYKRSAATYKGKYNKSKSSTHNALSTN